MSMRALLDIRGEDVHGAGYYGAPRGSREHKGIDFACYSGTTILPIKAGKVTKLGYPYADKLEFRYVQITDKAGYRWRYFYIQPSVVMNQVVTVHTELGKVQKLPYEGITQHCHLEIKNPDGEFVDPTTML